MKVAYIFSSQGHTVSYKLGKMILPQLEEDRYYRILTYITVPMSRARDQGSARSTYSLARSARAMISRMARAKSRAS